MVRRRAPMGLLLLALAIGCSSSSGQFAQSPLGKAFEDFTGVPLADRTPVVPANPFGNQSAPTATRQVQAYAPATTAVALRVYNIGQKVVQCNPQLPQQIRFQTIGSPAQEIFHQGPHNLMITEGLVKACANDGQLAAVLCSELGKMSAERIALADPGLRQPTFEAPPDVPIGGHNGGAVGEEDPIRAAELARAEQKFNRSSQLPALPPDPQQLAQNYYSKAGYQRADFDAVVPLLQNLDLQKHEFENQMNQRTPVRPFVNE